jgi:hypothetical protein
MDRDAGQSDRGDEARQGDTGMIGSEAEEPGPGRDTSLTDPDPVAAGTDQPRGTVAMSEGDPMRTRLGSHVEGAGAIGYDVAGAEEGATQQTPTDDRPGYEPERPYGDAAVAPAASTPLAYERDPDLAGEPVADRPASYDPGPGVGIGDRLDDAGPVDRSVVADEPTVAGYREQPGGARRAGYEGEPGGAGLAGAPGEPGVDAPATYTGEEADVAGRPEYADRTERLGDQPLYEQEPQRMDRPGGGASLFGDEEDRLDRPGPQGEPGVDQSVYDQEADRARRERPSEGM